MKEKIFEIRIIRSARRTISLEVTRNGEAIVRAPYRMSEEKIAEFTEKHREWLEIHLKKRREKSKREELFDADKDNMKLHAKEVIFPKVKYYSEIMGVFPSKVRISEAKTRFGSCSSENSLSFSYRLMMYPEKVIDYVVIHELSHILHHNHGKDFWKTVEEFMPDYKEAEKMLKD